MPGGLGDQTVHRSFGRQGHRQGDPGFVPGDRGDALVELGAELDVMGVGEGR